MPKMGNSTPTQFRIKLFDARSIAAYFPLEKYVGTCRISECFASNFAASVAVERSNENSFISQNTSPGKDVLLPLYLYSQYSYVCAFRNPRLSGPFRRRRRRRPLWRRRLSASRRRQTCILGDLYIQGAPSELLREVEVGLI